MTTQIEVRLPPLHPGQLEIASSMARFKVVVCGRRWGKTTFGVWLCLKSAIEKAGIYWWIAPIVKTAEIGWKMLKRLIRQFPRDLVEIRESDKAAIFPNGSEVHIRSSHEPENLRGEGLSGAVLDEAGSQHPDVWTESIRPALADKLGWALFIGTPRGKNWFFKLYQRAETLPGWEAWKKPSSTNPYLSEEELKSAEIEMADDESGLSREKYAQEFEADFGASSFLVYPEFDRNIHKWIGPVPEFVSFYGGMDFGGTSISSHKSTGVIAGRSEKDEVILISEFEQAGPNIAERQFNWAVEQEMKLRKLFRALKRPESFIKFRADKTQMVGIQVWRQMGLNVYPTKGGRDSVEEGIEMVHRRLAPRFNSKPRLYYLDGLHFIPEAFERYRYDEPDLTRPSSKTPLKVNDDMIDAVRYCIEGIDRFGHGDPAKLYGAQIPRVGEFSGV